MTAPGAARLRRGSLTPESIAESALALLDEEGVDGFSMPRLGKRLQASSTAMYRHFESREDILRAIGELLYAEMLDGFEPADDWVQTLRNLSVRLWDTYTRHLAAASLSFPVMTRGPHELRAAEVCLTALRQGGWEGEKAAEEYLAFAVFSIGLAGSWATYLMRAEADRAADSVAWGAASLMVRLRDFPSFVSIAPHMTDLDADVLYSRQVEHYLSSLASSAPVNAADEA